METEVWKDIVEFENYQVSNFGSVRRKSCQIVYSNGMICNYKDKSIRLEKINKRYKRVTICKNNTPKRFQVHRLVAIHFIENPENKPCVNHIDGNPSNNHVSNLEWCTYSENELHSYNVLGKVNSQRKLSIEDVEYIRKHTSKDIKYLLGLFPVDRTTIINVLNRKYYV